MPGADVTETRTPREIKFDPDYLPPVYDNRPYIPKKYAGKLYDMGTHRTPAAWEELYGRDKVKILPREGDPTRGVVGLWGETLYPGDVAEMPVNFAMLMVQQGVAVFVVSSETAKDEKLIAELEGKGYAFATTTQKPAREREEFASVIARKKKAFVGSVLFEPKPPGTQRAISST